MTLREILESLLSLRDSELEEKIRHGVDFEEDEQEYSLVLRKRVVMEPFEIVLEEE